MEQKIECLETTEWTLPDGSTRLFKQGKEYDDVEESVMNELKTHGIVRVVLSSVKKRK